MAAAVRADVSSAAKQRIMISMGELKKKHNKSGDAWVAVNGDMYDVSKFAKLHPGEELNLLEHAGGAVIEVLYRYHSHEFLAKQTKLRRIGRLVGFKQIHLVDSKEISNVLFAELSYWMGCKSLCNKESHKKLRAEVRKLLDSCCDEAKWGEATGTPPSKELYQLLGSEGFLASRIGPAPLKFADKLPGGLAKSEIDQFHEDICYEEVTSEECSSNPSC